MDQWNNDQAGLPDDYSPDERTHDKAMKLWEEFHNRKQHEAELIKQRKEYWADVEWQQDRMYDGSDEQGWE